MGLIVYPKDGRGKERDDRYMLEHAEKYGAVILSNDKFSNHFDYRMTASKYRIGYERRKKKVDYDNITNEIPIGCTYVFHTKNGEFIITYFLNIQ